MIEGNFVELPVFGVLNIAAGIILQPLIEVWHGFQTSAMGLVVYKYHTVELDAHPAGCHVNQEVLRSTRAMFLTRYLLGQGTGCMGTTKSKRPSLIADNTVTG